MTGEPAIFLIYQNHEQTNLCETMGEEKEGERRGRKPLHNNYYHINLHVILSAITINYQIVKHL